MHEYAVARALVDRVESEARARGALRAVALHVRVGELSGVDADLLRTAYDACRPGTVCGDAALEISPVSIRWTCARCDAEVPAAGPRRCAACGAPARLTRGDELQLERIDLEVA